jgi:hypothetical protein
MIAPQRVKLRPHGVARRRRSPVIPAITAIPISIRAW